MGTEVHARGRGLASKVIRERQKVAAAEKLPIWVEASKKNARDVYARCGFEVIGEMKLGAGTHDAAGFKEEGGPGVTIWSMIWEPPNEGSAEKSDATK